PCASYSLKVELLPRTPPSNNDVYSAATTLMFVAGSASVTGDTSNSANNYASSCQAGTSSSDVVYSFTSPLAQRFPATATTAADSGYLPSLFVREQSACLIDGGLLGPDGGLSSYPGCVNATV